MKSPREHGRQKRLRAAYEIIRSGLDQAVLAQRGNSIVDFPTYTGLALAALRTIYGIARKWGWSLDGLRPQLERAEDGGKICSPSGLNTLSFDPERRLHVC
jgi:hypothetical protein